MDLVCSHQRQQHTQVAGKREVYNCSISLSYHFHRVDALWKGLTGTLSGMFCASLEQMKITVTGSPTYCFKHEGNNNFAKNQSTDSVRLRYSVLPREAICTENLTPWIKMLPCRSKVPLRKH